MAFDVKGLGPDPEGATPLADEELKGLIPGHVTTRRELNEVEYENLLAVHPSALASAKRSNPADILTLGFLFKLHKKLFSDVWTWAGTQRRRETNIGVDPTQIAEQVKLAVDDARYWHEHGIHPHVEVAVRLHHRLVAIHPFPNGNGRCTRLMADLYLVASGEQVLPWGGPGDIGRPSAIRTAYLDALRAADAGEYQPLLDFASGS